MMIGPAASFSVRIAAKLKGAERAAPELRGTVLVDAALADGTTTDVLPTWQHLTFSAINSGNATINGNGDLVLGPSGTGYVNVSQDVQVADATGPYIVYFMWTWNGLRTYFGEVTIPDNQDYTVTTSGLISLGGSPLALYIATNLPGHTLTYGFQDFQLLTPDTFFPAFFPFLPTPVGADQPIPTFPPPTPPPIGIVPVGEFAVLAIKSGPVGISVAGINQPVIGGNNPATFPDFTTTFPSPTFVVSNVWTVPTIAGGVWTTHLPAYTTTTQNIALGGWGLPGPSGQGPGPPTYPNPPGAGKPFMVEQAANENGNGDEPAAEETTRRRRRREA